MLGAGPGRKPAVLQSREGYNTVPSCWRQCPREAGGRPSGEEPDAAPTRASRSTAPSAWWGAPTTSRWCSRFKDDSHYEYRARPRRRGRGEARRPGLRRLQQISAMVLREVREFAQNQLLKQPASRAVVTVPAYYNDNQRQAVREAGRLAGLHVSASSTSPPRRRSPTDSRVKLNQRVLVYDLGGGHLRRLGPRAQRQHLRGARTGGDTFLGGIDFDSAIVGISSRASGRRRSNQVQGDRGPPPDRRRRGAGKITLSERHRVHGPPALRDDDGREAHGFGGQVFRRELEDRRSGSSTGPWRLHRGAGAGKLQRRGGRRGAPGGRPGAARRSCTRRWPRPSVAPRGRAPIPGRGGGARCRALRGTSLEQSRRGVD